MATVTVRHLEQDRFSVDVGSHSVTVDQPVDAGGQDAGPTPTELFVVALASCVAHYARRYLARHRLPTEGLQVTASWTLVSGPSRVGAVDVVLTVPDQVPDDRRDALLAVASHCTVHNSLVQPPEVSVVLRD